MSFNRELPTVAAVKFGGIAKGAVKTICSPPSTLGKSVLGFNIYPMNVVL
jgi:hypothetical protein